MRVVWCSLLGVVCLCVVCRVLLVGTCFLFVD